MYKKVLFATDFDEVGINAAHKAKKIADENKAELILVHVVEPIPAYAYPGFAGFAEVEVSIREQAEKELNTLAERLKVDEKHRFLEFGSTKNEVLRVAKENNIDLIVTGSHGKHGLALLLGSTANAILHGAQCDVLIVRSHQD
ncbi:MULTISPECIES: universal stress protein [Legionella]|uniref:Universal stress protein n=1 Tax=Legionella septentrionalis TaxID=2498109 RepID=A0A433JKQ8_9GAMM|nr:MULTISPECIES: universal stress protein [Legionella]MCP0914494.1 universal stress protein [Legionella sp. 27cVA30]RUQ89445.1 universal stress protein [Legionella septentrionalis]RUQ95599.1 universal stress protein [Legionella septentrionalis]RUR10458.1 universal stress protein [Legionella septentrionalis]RUR16078.1 universal stress protein [Legionella septentrionalis]